jgi:hypothetical protein
MIIRAVKKLISTSVFGFPRVYFFAFVANKHPQGPHRDAACAPARLFIFSRWRALTTPGFTLVLFWLAQKWQQRCGSLAHRGGGQNSWDGVNPASY